MISLVKWFKSESDWDSPNKAPPTPSTQAQHQVSSVAHASLDTSANHEHSPVRSKPSNRTIVRLPELDLARAEAKKLEWKLSLKALLEAFDVHNATNSNNSIPEPIEFLENRISIIFDHLRLLNTSCDTPTATPVESDNAEDLRKIQAEELAGQLTKNVRSLTKEAVAALLLPYFSQEGQVENTHLLQQHASELYYEVTRCFYGHNSFDYEYDVLQNDIAELTVLLEGSSYYLDIDPASRTKAILTVLRQALTRPAYLLMRCDENQSQVRLLHNLVVASFAHSETISSYILLGKAVCDAAKSHIKRNESLGDILTTARETAANAGFPEDDPLVNNWIISRTAEKVLPEKMASSISRILDVVSIGFSYLAAGISVKQTFKAVVSHAKAYFYDTQKDYRGYYNNLNSVYYEEHFVAKDDASVDLRVIIGPSAAQGSTVLPEFSALLQALENRRRSPEIESYPYAFLTYTNLQNRFGGAEGLQTNALMHLNERYPLSFDAITLSADPLPNCKDFVPCIQKTMIDLLQSEQTYTLKDLSVKSNYYFPLRNKQKWDSIFEQIVKRSYTFVEENTMIPNDKRVAIFCDLVHLSIVRYRETQLVAAFMTAGENRKILASRICAVCVDRGMMVNSELLYLLSNKAKATAAIDIGRGILAKGRLPLEKRVSQIGIFGHNSLVTNNVLKFLDKIQALATEDFLHIKSMGISYPGTTPDLLPHDQTPQAKRKLFVDDTEIEKD